MGQPVTVVRKESSNAGVVRFEINRSITGMSHEHYAGIPGPEFVRPCDELAKGIFAHDGVKSLHINSNVITVTVEEGFDSSPLLETIENMFIYYRPGVEVAAVEG